MTAKDFLAGVVLLFVAIIIIGGSIITWYENRQARKNNIVKWEPGSNNRH